MRGIILAGDHGNAFYPATRGTNKHLLPLFDKPLIYFPLATLIEAGCREVLITCKAIDLPQMRRLLGDGSDLGMWLTYKVEPGACSVPQALVMARDFIGDGPVCVIAGDQVIAGGSLAHRLRKARHRKFGASVVTSQPLGRAGEYYVSLDKGGRPLALTTGSAPHGRVPLGLFLFHNGACEAAKTIPSDRPPHEQLRSLHEWYLSQRQLFNIALPEDTICLAPRSAAEFHDATAAIRTLAEERSILAGVIEASAYQAGFIDRRQVDTLAKRAGDTVYGNLLRQIAEAPPVAA